MIKSMMEYDARKKSMAMAYLAWFFLGILGVHRFYLGRTGSGVAQLVLTVGGWLLFAAGVGVFMLGVLAVWLLVDMFLIPGMVGDYNLALARSMQPVQRPTAQAALVRPTTQAHPDLHKWAD